MFNKPASTTLNQDEAVSRGAALQCAIMSPAVRVREFGVTDIQNYAVKVLWDGDGSSSNGEVEIFPQFHPSPFSRLVTIARKGPFTASIVYGQPVPYPDQTIGVWKIKEVKPTERGESQDVKLKVRINQNGIVLISSATLVDRKEQEEAAAAAGEQAASEEKTSGEQPAGESTEAQPEVSRISSYFQQHTFIPKSFNHHIKYHRCCPRLGAVLFSRNSLTFSSIFL